MGCAREERTAGVAKNRAQLPLVEWGVRGDAVGTDAARLAACEVPEHRSV